MTRPGASPAPRTGHSVAKVSVHTAINGEVK